MDINIPLVVIALVVLAALVIFIILKNRKDRRKLENKLTNDYKKPRENEGDIDIEERESI